MLEVTLWSSPPRHPEVEVFQAAALGGEERFYCKSCIKHFRNTVVFFPSLSFPFPVFLELIKPHQTKKFFYGQYRNTFGNDCAFYKDGSTFYIELPSKGFFLRQTSLVSDHTKADHRDRLGAAFNQVHLAS